MISTRRMVPITMRFEEGLGAGAGFGSGFGAGFGAAGFGAGAGWEAGFGAGFGAGAGRGGAATGCSGATEGAAAAIGAPQLSQNLAPSGTGAPHCSQNMVKAGYFFFTSLTFAGIANVEAGILAFSSSLVTIWELLAPRMPLVSIFRMMPCQTHTL